MTCNICNKANRIFLNGQLVCPYCNRIRLIDKSIALRDLNDKLQKKLHEFRLLISHSNYHDILIFALNVRENAAKELADNPNSEEEAMRWLGSLFLLANLPKVETTKGEVTPMEVLTLASETLDILSSIVLCEQDKQVFLETGVRCNTELQILFRTPSEVDQESFEALGFHGIPESKRFIEQMLKASMIEQLDIVKSEALSRNLRTCFPKYLLPYKDTDRMIAYKQIAISMASFVAIQLGPHFNSSNGVLSVPISEYRDFEKEFARRHGDIASDFLSPKDIDYYGDNLALNLIVHDAKNSVVHLPYHSLVLLTMISHRYVIDLKEYRSQVGEEPEDWIYGFLKGYFETFTPKTKEKLLRFHIGKDQGEIDVAGFNEKKIVIVESKFWESSNVSEIEKELDKFEKRLILFEQNKDKYGFSSEQEVIPLFYNPWPPYPKYGRLGIILIPSLVALIWYVVSKFPPIVRPYAKCTEQITSFLAEDTEDRLFMSDLSSYLPLEKDMYRIQDIQVESIDENEVVAYSYAPMGYAYPFIYDLGDECQLKLKKTGVKKGSVLRTCTYNLQGYWFQIQIVDFRIICLEKSFDPERVLTELNPTQYDEFLAGFHTGYNGNELREIATRDGISLKKFFNWAEKSGHNVYAAAGILLGRAMNPRHKFYQCECGDVASVPSDIHIELVKRYGSDLKCRKCDPSLQSKIEEISGQKMMTLCGHRKL